MTDEVQVIIVDDPDHVATPQVEIEVLVDTEVRPVVITSPEVQVVTLDDEDHIVDEVRDIQIVTVGEIGPKGDAGDAADTAALTHAATSKTPPVDADEFALIDSAASWVLKKLTWANLKATIKAYTDTLYPSGSGTSTGTNTGDQTNISGNAATVTTNANLTGHVTSTGNAAVLGTFSVAQLNTALSDGAVATGGGTATGTNTGDNAGVTSITVTGANGIGISGSPITSSGTIGLSLGDITPTSVSTPSIITASGALTVTPAAGSNFNLNLSTTGDLAVNTNQLYVDTSEAKVGIGTATPDELLHIRDGNLRVSHGTNSQLFFSGINGSSPQIVLGNDGGTKHWAVYQTLGASGEQGTFKIQDITSGNVAKFSIAKAGYYGFGFLAPTATIHVANEGNKSSKSYVGSSDPLEDCLKINYYSASDNSYVRYLDIAAQANFSAGLGGSQIRFFTNSELSGTGVAGLILDKRSRVLLGTTGTTIENANRLQVAGTTAATNSIGVSAWSADALGSRIELGKSRGAAIGTNTIVQDGDVVGSLLGYGANGSTFTNLASIGMEVDGTPGATNDMPGRIVFKTTPNGSGTLTEAMRLSQDQTALFASSITTAAPTAGTAAPWKIGSHQSAIGLTMVSTEYVEVDVSGTAYKFALAA